MGIVNDSHRNHVIFKGVPPQTLFFNNVEKICFKKNTAFLLKRLFSPSGHIRVPVDACS